MSASTATHLVSRPLSAGRGLLYLLLSAASWGTAGAAAALLYGSSGLGPVALTFWRSAGGSALLLVALAVRRRGPAGRPSSRPRTPTPGATSPSTASA